MRVLHMFTTAQVVEPTELNADVYNLLSQPGVTEVTIRATHGTEKTVRSFFKHDDE